jgi:hypothetical protein
MTEDTRRRVLKQMLVERQEESVLFYLVTPMAVVRTSLIFFRTAYLEETAFLFLRSLLGHFRLALLRLLQHAYTYVLVNGVRNLLFRCRFRGRLA